jgi:NAD(P)-dependent dehydrogenase (short-subunit alcohol dehydrogenase family)
MDSLNTDQDNRLQALARLGNAVIIGSSGGIGQALAHKLLTNFEFKSLFCLSRSGHRPDPLAVAETSRTALIGLPMDLTHEDSIAEAALKVSQAGPLSLVLVATGMLQDTQQSPEKTMRHLSADALLRSFQINAVGPALLAKHFLPLMTRQGPSVFGALSARVGSISDNRSGGWYSYRASKAGLNMLIQTLALEHARKFPLGICVAIHPGTVDTQLSKPFQSGVPAQKLFTPDQSAGHIINLVQHLTPEDTGGLFAWDGQKISP